MSYPTRTELLNHLQNDWGRYVATYRALPTDAQRNWLAAQGYDRFADLLAHVIAWWEDGYAVVTAAAAGHPLAPKEYDVDAFNAAAVARFSAADEEAVSAAFEARRRQWEELIAQLPDQVLAEPAVAHRLALEVATHWQEHTLTPP